LTILRVLVLTPDFPPLRGGIHTLAYQLVRHARSFDALVVTPASPRAREFDAGQDFEVRRVRNLPGRRLNTLIRLNVEAFRHAGRFEPDAVLSMHTNTSPAAWAVSRAFGAPMLQYLHAEELPRRPRLGSWAISRASASVAVSRHTRDLALARGADPDRLQVIPPGVDPPAAGASATRAGRPTVLTVSRLDDAYKGHDVLARALVDVRERVPDVEWVVLGDGALRPGLEQLVAELGVADHVRFEGSVSDAERDEWLARAHVFAMPSRVPPDEIGGEGFGIAYVEAAAHGLPVVAGREGGATDAVVDGQTGLLVDPRDSGAIATAICELLLDPTRAAALGRAGAARATEFAWSRVAAQIEALTRELVIAQRPRGRQRRRASV
jgi:phosphatidylinositol alpha-1,6-mannosyltransferase